MKRIISLFALILAILFSFSACSLAGSNGGTVNLKDIDVDYIKAADLTKNPKLAVDRTDTCVFGTGSASFEGTWNYLFTSSAYDLYASYLMFDFNIETDFDGSVKEGATSYKISDDGLTYTFTLKDGIKFWNGDKVTASDLEFVYYLLADPNYDGFVDMSVPGIKGFKEYKEDKTGSVTSISGIKVKDEKTLEITINEKNSAALFKLQIPVMSKKYYGSDFKKGDIEKVKAKNNIPMGSGQYKFVSYKEGELLTLVANDNYYKGKPKIKNVLFSQNSDNQELQRVIAGETDIDMATVSEDNMTQAKNTGYIDIYRFPTNGFGYIAFNLILDKFKDIKVRQALTYALNRQQVVNQVFGSYAKVINIPQSSVSWAYNDDGIKAYEFNTETAAKLLDEAGWKLNANGKREKDGKEFTIKFSITDNSVTSVLAPLMKDEYKKLGIDVTVETLDSGVLSAKIDKNELEAYFYAFGLTAEPSDFNVVFQTNGIQNYNKYSNTKVDKLLEDSAKEIDINKRKAIYKDLYKLLNEELPLTPIYQRSDMWVVNGRIKGIEVSTYRELFWNFYKCQISK